MTTEKMTIHKALCELKIIDDRIEKAVNAQPFVFANKHFNTKVNGVTVADYSAQIKSEYQSVTDLIARRNAIKQAVVLSNAKITVTIAGKQYTVAEAIDMKNHGIPVKKYLFEKLSRDLKNAQNVAEKNNGDVLDTRADQHITTLYANADMKNLSDEIKKVRSDFITSQTVEVIDPINVNKEIEALEKEIANFTVEVDSALSVSNALTEIEITY